MRQKAGRIGKGFDDRGRTVRFQFRHRKGSRGDCDGVGSMSLPAGDVLWCVADNNNFAWLKPSAAQLVFPLDGNRTQPVAVMVVIPERSGPKEFCQAVVAHLYPGAGLNVAGQKIDPMFRCGVDKHLHQIQHAGQSASAIRIAGFQISPKPHQVFDKKLLHRSWWRLEGKMPAQVPQNSRIGAAGEVDVWQGPP